MLTSAVDHGLLRSSVIAVPPLCRDRQHRICPPENARLVRHLETGGVRSLLYGGNANLYHVRLSEYAALLELLQSTVDERTLVIPSVGPAYGMMMDQGEVLRDFAFPTVMVLPQVDVMTEAGLMTGFRDFATLIDRPAVLYIKRDGYLSPRAAAKLVTEGLVSFIKYAIVRDDPHDDRYLRELVDVVDPRLIVSGIGEQPAIVHLNEFGLAGFTSGCVCVAPSISQRMLQALTGGDLSSAEDARATFGPLEDLRNAIHPIRVLHAAIELAGIATTGPLQPLLSGVQEDEAERIKKAASDLLATELQVREGG